MDFTGIDKTGVTDEPDYTPVPEGEYEVYCESAEEGLTKRGDGRVLKAVFVVHAPFDFINKKIFHNFNVQNPSLKAQQIGVGQLDRWSVAVTGKKIGAGQDEIPNSELLIGKRVLVKVIIELGTGKFRDKNKIVKFMSLSKEKEVQSVQPSTQSTRLTVENDNTPW